MKIKEKILKIFSQHPNFRKATKAAFWTWILLVFLFFNLMVYYPFWEIDFFTLILIFIFSFALFFILIPVFYLGIRIQEKIPPILKEAILLAFYCWFILDLILLAFGLWRIKGTLSLDNFISSLFSVLSGIIVGSRSAIEFFELPCSNLFLLNFFLFTIGFFLGIKFLRKGKKKLVFIFFIFPALICAFFEIFFRMPSGSDELGLYLAFSPLYFLYFFVIYSILPFAASLLFYFKRERLFFRINKIIFYLFFIALIVVSITSFLIILKIGSGFQTLKRDAVGLGNPDLCQRIKEDGEKSLFSVQTIVDRYYIPCIEEVAIKVGREDLCENLLGTFKNKYKPGQALELTEGIVRKCKRKFFINTIESCNSIAEERAKEDCAKEAILRMNDQKLCEVMFNHSCIEEIGLREKASEIELCKKKEKSEIQDCITEIALKTGNPSICEKIPDFKNDLCFKKMALKLDDVKTCKRILNDYTKNECIKEVAVKTNNFAACEEIDKALSIIDRDSCFEAIAVNLNNPELCDRIETNYIKRSCYEKLSR